MSARLVTQIFPVVSCQHPEEIRVLMQRLGVVSTRTYNKLGSLKGWGLHWQKAYPIIKGIKDTQEYQLPSKLCEWTVSDVQKAISAQQTTKKQSKAINRKLNSWIKGELQDSLESMNNTPASLHRFA